MSASPVPPGAPARIWLNLCDEADCGEPFESHHGGAMGVTWTEDTPALLHAVEYARADLLHASESEVRRLRGALEEIAGNGPPNDWEPYDHRYGYCGYGTRGELGFVDEPDESNYDDVHRHGIGQGEWHAAKIARAALAPTGEPGNG